MMSMALWRSSLLLTVLFMSGYYCHPEDQSKIVLENNGYRGILVSISDSLTEDLDLLERIKVCYMYRF